MNYRALVGAAAEAVWDPTSADLEPEGATGSGGGASGGDDTLRGDRTRLSSQAARAGRRRRIYDVFGAAAVGFWPFSSSAPDYLPNQYAPVAGPGGRALTQLEEQFTRAFQDFNNLVTAWKGKNARWVGMIQPLIDLKDEILKDYQNAVALYQNGDDPQEQVKAVAAKYMNLLRNYAHKTLLDMDNKVQDFSEEIKRKAYIAALDQLDKDLGRPVEQVGKLARGAAEAGAAAENALARVLTWLPWIGVAVVGAVVLPYAAVGILKAARAARAS